MNSCQSSGFSPSPTVVQSPVLPTCNIASLPVTPTPHKETDPIPVYGMDSGRLNIPTVTLCESGYVGKAQISGLDHSDSFHIEHIPNVKEIDPEWEHDEIDEIMVISPKLKARNSFLDLGETEQHGINDFEVLKVVGKEPSLQTILARSCSDFGLYAIKTLGKRAASTPNLLKHVRSEQTCLRIVTEGGCPFLPKLHRSFHDDTRLYMVLDTYPGGNIAMHLDREGPFAPDRARFYACEIISALSFLHSLRIVHRDVKPENVMIGSDGHIVLTNFSCAKILDQCESTDSDCGTREFEAPERILGWAYDFAVDVWSFGVLLCIMHFGQHPFLEGDELDPLLIMQKRILRGQEPSHPSRLVPLAEWNLIKKCLERNALLRPEIRQVKSHEYFLGIDWDRVENKKYPAPYVPYGDEVDLLGVDEEIFHFYDRSDLLALDDSSITDTDFDGFTFTWDPSQASSDKTAVHIVPDPADLASSVSESTSGRKNTIRSILKHPSIYFAGDPKSNDIDPSDFLDLHRSASRIRLGTHSQRPRRLQKKHLSGAGARASVLSSRKSMMSILTDISVGRVGRRKCAYRVNCSGGSESPDPGESVTLPNGIIRTGQGIGFTYAPQASRSRLSLSSTKNRSCFKGISTLFSKLRNSPEDLPRSKGEVMQQIYGSTWSLRTNEAQMSTVSFALPEGLGRRIDSPDMQVQHSTQSCSIKQS